MPEVILKQDIYRLGDRGSVVRVAHGYARNYLYPQGLAIPADKGSLKQLDAMQSAAEREALRLRGDAEKQVTALEGVVIRIVARASLNNQLYGSVTGRDVAARLGEEGIDVDRRRIQLTTPIRALGDYEIPIHIYKDISSAIKLEVRAEGREDEPLYATPEALAPGGEAAASAEPPAAAEASEAETDTVAAGSEASAAEAEASAEPPAAAESPEAEAASVTADSDASASEPEASAETPAATESSEAEADSVAVGGDASAVAAEAEAESAAPTVPSAEEPSSGEDAVSAEAASAEGQSVEG